MSSLTINTVDRLDRPSAYYVGKVCVKFLYIRFKMEPGSESTLIESMQNKRRRYNDRDDEREREEDPSTKLQNATTLYVGNLYGPHQVLTREGPLR